MKWPQFIRPMGKDHRETPRKRKLNVWFESPSETTGKKFTWRACCFSVGQRTKCFLGSLSLSFLIDISIEFQGKVRSLECLMQTRRAFPLHIPTSPPQPFAIIHSAARFSYYSANNARVCLSVRRYTQVQKNNRIRLIDSWLKRISSGVDATMLGKFMAASS